MVALAAGLILAQGASPSDARQAADAADPFLACDGFGSPSNGGDGMSEQAMVLGIFLPSQGGDTVQRGLQFSAQGVGACDRALADKRLLPDYWRRKVSLLRARAAHRMAAGDVQAGLADLDLAEAAAVKPNDPLYRRSLGLGLSLVRAYGLRLSGDRSAAEALTRQAWQTRPYDRETILSALIVIGPSSTATHDQDLLAAAARVDPSLIDAMFDDAVTDRRFAEVVSLYPQLSGPGYGDLGHPRPSADPQIEMAQRYMAWLEHRLTAAARSAGEAAYAYAALGDPEKGRALLERQRQEVIRLTAPAARIRERADTEENRLKPAVRGRVEAQLDRWAALVERRILLADGRADEALANLDEAKLPRSGLVLELLSAGGKAPTPSARPAPSPAQELAALMARLPGTDTRSRLARYRAIKPSDYTKDRSIDDPLGIEMVYETFKGSPSMAREAALFRVAELVRREGRKTFVLTSVVVFREASQPTMYGQPIGPEHHVGYKVFPIFRVVDPAALPPKFSDARWRVLDADAVYESLAPIYGKDADLQTR